MIEIKQKTINNVPLLELVDESIQNEKLPTVVFFHGWTNVKESVLVNGYELAKRGMRAILPEAYLHGERDETGKATENNLIFWDVVTRSIFELKEIIADYVERDLTDENKIGVTGLSMGGITTAAALTQYDWITAAVILMGSPSPLSFSEWMLTSTNPHQVETSDVEKHSNIDIKKATEQLINISLDVYPETIQGRPLHFWHGTEDKSVPFDITQQFIEKHQNDTYGRNITFHVGEGDEHKVPYNITVEMAEYFKNKL